MTPTPRLALIHATRLSIAPVEEAAARIWPEAELVSILEEGLSIDRSKDKALTGAVSARIAMLANYAKFIGASGILFTCSAFGEAIEAVADDLDLPVLKPNEAMFEDAFTYGARAVLLHTFAPSGPSMVDEFRRVAIRRGSKAILTPIFCDHAFAAKHKGDADWHNQLVARAAADADQADVILFAQFSMASAATLARTLTDTPFLTSPETALQKMKHCLQGT